MSLRPQNNLDNYAPYGVAGRDGPLRAPLIDPYRPPVYRHQPTPQAYPQPQHRRSRSVSPHPWSVPSNPASWYGIHPNTPIYSPVHTDRGSDLGGPPAPIEAMPRGAHAPRVDEILMGPENYSDWCHLVKWLFIIHQVLPYVEGTIPRPDPEVDPIGARNWSQNDAFACSIITSSISSSQRKHTNPCDNSYAMWKALKAVHESRGHQTVINYIRTLFRCSAEEDADIPHHLDIIKETWERINALGSEHFQISDLFFKIIIASSLPPSWDHFTETYIGSETGFVHFDPKKQMSSQEFIGVIISEYNRRVSHVHGTLRSDTVNINPRRSNAKGKSSLITRISQRSEAPQGKENKGGDPCRLCKKTSHITHDCPRWDDLRCDYCHRPGHREDDCWHKHKDKKPEYLGNKNKFNKCSRREEANKGEKGEEEGEEVALHVVDPRSSTYTADPSASITWDVIDAADDDTLDDVIPVETTFSEQVLLGEEDETVSLGENEAENLCTYINNNVVAYTAGNEDRSLYDWIVDSASTSHICNKRDVFTEYIPTHDQVPIYGVGNIATHALGRGKVIIGALYNNKLHKITLNDVLYVPNNRHNLLSLGRWERANGKFKGGQGITLISPNGTHIGHGILSKNNLYTMKFRYLSYDKSVRKQYSLTTQTQALTWEAWHRRFGHVSYTGLGKLHSQKLVDGFTLDTRSPKPDCPACIAAKHSEKPFGSPTKRVSQPGELTHADLWGKYDVTSINGCQYYLLLIDDATRYITVRFLKTKDQAASQIKNYFTYLSVREKQPRAIRIDRGTEFVNNALMSWCEAHGIDVQRTAPYSPSQNGVAERMNRTLVELARAMLAAAQLPEFLWEPAVEHAAYIRNRSFTTSLQGITPYQAWHDNKPNVAHLREFGAPVWILLQGQKVPRKMLPKSARRAYVGHDDGSGAVKYYNAQSRKVLTSRNFHLLSSPDPEPEPELCDPIVVTPEVDTTAVDHNIAPEGGPGSSTRNTQKRKAEDSPPNAEPKRTRGVRIDYKMLNDPFSDNEDNADEETLHTQYINAAEIGGDIHSLVEARKSDEWPEWKSAIQAELNQLEEMGTWKLVDKPPGVTPIANKWVFAKKRDKMGQVTKFKARLVAKGCAQRPGHDYVETHSPVVRLETIRAILSLIPKEKLIVRQMDVKGAYLNGTLKERVYMRQPEGYEDGTDRMCLLIKTLYGLKQAGREWNIEFDDKMKKHGFVQLLSDPCVYIRRDHRGIAIITVWVDDLLLFASSIEAMEAMSDDLKSEWQMTELGEPSKIVGIEIVIGERSITISQKKYIENILLKEGLERANPVSMPLDPNAPLEPNPDGGEGDRSNSYARLLGELQFLANATRPDIAFAVNRLASYTANPSIQHISALKRILRYLAGTKSYGITYTADSDQSNLFHGYADAAYGNLDERKSTTGYVFIAGKGAITWRSKKQQVVALSSTEAEYVALSEAAREACWLRSLFKELGYEQNYPTQIHGDNEGALAMAKNPQFHQRAKHIDIKWHSIRQMIKRKKIQVESCRGQQQTADVLTKALPRPKHKQHVSEMGMAPI